MQYSLKRQPCETLASVTIVFGNVNQLSEFEIPQYPLITYFMTQVHTAHFFSLIQ